MSNSIETQMIQGAATAYLAAERGYAVCVNYLRNQKAAQKIVDKIEQLGGQAIARSLFYFHGQKSINNCYKKQFYGNILYLSTEVIHRDCISK